MAIIVDYTPAGAAADLAIRSGKVRARRDRLIEETQKLQNRLAIRREDRADQEADRRARLDTANEVFRRDALKLDERRATRIGDQTDRRLDQADRAFDRTETLDAKEQERYEARQKVDEAERLYRKTRDLKNDQFRAAEQGYRLEAMDRAREAEEAEKDVNRTMGGLILENAVDQGMLDPEANADQITKLQAIAADVPPERMQAFVLGIASGDQEMTRLARNTYLDSVAQRNIDDQEMTTARIEQIMDEAEKINQEMLEHQIRAADPGPNGEALSSAYLDRLRMMNVERAAAIQAQQRILDRQKLKQTMIRGRTDPRTAAERDRRAGADSGNMSIQIQVGDIVAQQMAEQAGIPVEQLMADPSFATTPQFQLLYAKTMMELGWEDFTIKDIMELQKKIEAEQPESGNEKNPGRETGVPGSSPGFGNIFGD